MLVDKMNEWMNVVEFLKFDLNDSNINVTLYSSVRNLYYDIVRNPCQSNKSFFNCSKITYFHVKIKKIIQLDQSLIKKQ